MLKYKNGKHEERQGTREPSDRWPKPKEIKSCFCLLWEEMWKLSPHHALTTRSCSWKRQHSLRPLVWLLSQWLPWERSQNQIVSQGFWLFPKVTVSSKGKVCPPPHWACCTGRKHTALGPPGAELEHQTCRSWKDLVRPSLSFLRCKSRGSFLFRLRWSWDALMERYCVCEWWLLIFYTI